MKAVVGAFFFTVAIATADAAQITTAPRQQGQPDVFLIQGDLVQGDDQRFVAAAAFSSSGIVLFQSNGGNLAAGIEIGKAIRMKAFATVVADDSVCASACAIAWLGGVRRLAGPNAHIGFHAASGQTGAEWGMANAILGAYLNQIGLPPEAIAYVTVANPQSITWLNFDDARKIGIVVEPFVLQPPATAAAPPPPVPMMAWAVPPAPPTRSALEQRTAEFIGKLFGTWPYPDAFEASYAPQVAYYGKIVPRHDVMIDKAKFVARWPQRKYVLRNVTTHCNEQQTYCTAEAWADWEVRNGAKMLSGTVHARYEIAWQQATPLITLETSEVTSRNQAPVASAPAPPPSPKASTDWGWPFPLNWHIK
jgi:hypothetical protein